MCECHKEFEEAYNEMVEKVATVDASAAEWLRIEAPQIEPFHFDGDLWECFVWADTPQGNRYWFRIASATEPDGLTP